MRRLRLLYVGCLTLMFMAAGSPGSVGSPQSAGPARPGDSNYRAVIYQYCAGCHNDKLKSGDLELTAFDVGNPATHPEIWEKVVRKLRGRIMPPVGRPRPDEKTYTEIIAYLESSLDRAA